MGPVENAVRGDVATMISTAPAGETLAQLAYTLAGMLDDGGQRCVNCGHPVAGADPQQAPRVSRELRAVLCELVAASVGDDDDLAAALSRVSAPVRDTSRP